MKWTREAVFHFSFTVIKMSLHVLTIIKVVKKRPLQGTVWGPRFKVATDLYMCVISQRLKAVKTPPGCVYNASGEWEGCTGVVGLVVCRPLTLCITDSISQSWFQWGGKLGRAVRSVEFRAAKENEEMKREEETRMKCAWYSGGDSYGVLLEGRRFGFKIDIHRAARHWIESLKLICLNLI